MSKYGPITQNSAQRGLDKISVDYLGRPLLGDALRTVQHQIHARAQHYDVGITSTRLNVAIGYGGFNTAREANTKYASLGGVEVEPNRLMHSWLTKVLNRDQDGIMGSSRPIGTIDSLQLQV
jgi:hypothetical protein